jgi:hypothetical protein
MLRASGAAPIPVYSALDQASRLPIVPAIANEGVVCS